MALNPATDNRGYTGTGSDQTRATAMTNQSGPVASNKQLFSGTLAGNVIASTANPKPLVPYLSDGTIVVRGFVTRSANNLTIGGLGETVCNVNAQTGTLVDYNAGGGTTPPPPGSCHGGIQTAPAPSPATPPGTHPPPHRPRRTTAPSRR